MATCTRAPRALSLQLVRNYSNVKGKNVKHYKVVIAGGGTGGCAVAARACRALGKGQVAVIDPAKTHYYQPMWTFVGAGIKKLDDSAKPMSAVLPKQCDHHKEEVSEFDPDNNTVTLGNGNKLSYDYLVVALGIQIDLEKVEGLAEALKEDPSVGSIYLPDMAAKTYSAMQNFRGGHALFTIPNTVVKCAGAPQKIMYMADEYWRKHGVRTNTDINYYTGLGVIFGVKKYAASLSKVVKRKDIKVHYRTTLKAVDHTKKVVTIALLDSDTGETETHPYDFLHVCPPQGAPDVLKRSPSKFIDAASGFLDVNKFTMQHNNYPNVFGVGDCTNLPTSKTTAAIGSQNKIVFNSLRQVIAGQTPDGQYDGYSACPVITGYHKCIMAEFDYNCEPLETFPIDQGKESRLMFQMKRYAFPEVYWNMLLTGHWSGSKTYRKIWHLGMSK